MQVIDQKKAYMYGISAVLLWSSVATAFKISLSFITPLQLLFFASIFSWITLFIVAFLQGELKLLKTLEKKEIFRMCLLGTLNPFAYYLVLFKAYSLLPAQEAQALNYTWALTLSYLAVFILKKPLGWQDIVSGFICYMGVLVIATRGDILSFEFSNVQGVALALFSTILWALYWIYNTKWTKVPTLGLFLNFSFGVVLIFLAMLFSGGFENIATKGVLGAAYVGIFEMGITFFLWLQALRFTQNTAKIANLIFLSPFISLIFISFLLKEEIFISTVIGLILIIFGLIFQQKSKFFK